MPLVTALPTPPSRANPATFSADADAFLAALAQFAAEVNAVGQAIVIGPMAAAAGTADAITANFTPDIALTNGQTVLVRAGYANATATPTFAPDGLTAKTIVKGSNGALVAGDIAGAGHWLLMQYDSTLDRWVLQNPATATKLSTARTIQTNLASTSSANFDGTGNVTPGISGTLGVGNGGTGATTSASALSALGGAPVPSSSSTVGQWIAVTASSGSSTLPAGGTWAYFGANNGYSFQGVAAGGTTIWTGTVNNFFGFCWRIA